MCCRGRRYPRYLRYQSVFHQIFTATLPVAPVNQNQIHCLPVNLPALKQSTLFSTQDKRD